MTTSLEKKVAVSGNGLLTINEETYVLGGAKDCFPIGEFMIAVFRQKKQ